MNKELSPLEALDDLRYGGLVDGNVVCFTKLAFEKRLDIIEKALKRLETLEEEKQSFDRELEKKLKALEIIKEKQVNVRDFIFYQSIYKVDDTVLTEKNTFDLCSGCCKNDLTQEEYEVLKEIML